MLNSYGSCLEGSTPEEARENLRAPRFSGKPTASWQQKEARERWEEKEEREKIRVSLP
jgi:hypothetical protein